MTIRIHRTFVSLASLALTIQLLAPSGLIAVARAQQQLWITQFGTSGLDAPAALASDAAGGLFVAGSTTGALGGPYLGGFRDAFLARHDSAGNQLWIKQIGTDEWDQAHDLTPDGAGGVFVAGRTHGDLGGLPVGSADMWLGRYDSAGNQLWITQFGTTEFDVISAIASDGEGGAFIAGYTEGSLGGPVAGPHDAWLARYDSAGNQLWIRQFGTSNHDQAWALAADGSGGVFIAGSTDGSLGGPHAGPYYYDAWIARYDDAGNQLWIRQFGTRTRDRAYALALAGPGSVMVAGFTQGSLAGPNAGLDDTWLARYDESGNQIWIRQFGTPKHDRPSAIAPDGVGGVMITGITLGSLGWPHVGKWDVYLARYDSEGNQLWMLQFGTSEDDLPSALVPAGVGGVFIAGRTDGNLGGPNAGRRDVWIARYGEATCYADCDQSTGPLVLDIFDFLCWQNEFVAGNSYACDCDTSTGPLVCDLLDFICFQDAFVGGCP